MSNENLRRAVRAALNNIGDRALNYRIAKKMRTLPTATREDALLLVATDAGINISQYAHDAAALDRVHRLRQSQPPPAPGDAPRSRRTQAPRPVTLSIGRDLKLKDPILPQRVIQEAKMMAEKVYPKLYVLENSVREVIMRVMRGTHGETWWNAHVPKEIREKVEGRKRDEQKKQWHGKRGAHEIYYTDITDLKRIVNSNYRIFRPVFPQLDWFNYTVEVINPSRNVSSHHNPLSRHDAKRVDVNLRDWQEHIAGKKSLIPE